MPSQFTGSNLTEVVAAVPISARSVLDLSCGDGEVGAALKERATAVGHGLRVSGVSADPVLADRARERLDEVVVGHPERIALPFLPCTFDAVVYLGSFDDFSRPHRMMRLCAQYLRPRGRVVTVASKGLAGLAEGAGLSLVPITGPGSAHAVAVVERPVSPEDFRGVSPFAFVMVGHNQAEQVTRTFQGLIELAGEAPGQFRVVLVDDASTDGVSRLKSTEDGSIFVLHNREETGVVAGLVQGVRAARAKIAVLLEAGFEVGQGFAAALLGAFAGDRNIAAVAPLVVSPGGLVASAGWEAPMARGSRALVNQYAGARSADPGVASPREVTGLDLRATAIRWTAFEMVGGLGTALELPAAGLDLATKLIEEKWSIRYEPSLRVVGIGE